MLFRRRYGKCQIRQYKPFDFLISDFKYKLAKAEYFDGYVGVEFVRYESENKDTAVVVTNDYRGELDVSVEKIESGQEFPIDQIIRFWKIRQLHLEKNEEVGAKSETKPFPPKYLLKVQVSKGMQKLASSLRYYAAPLLKGDDVFLSQLSEYCSVVNGLHTQSYTKDKRSNGVTRLIGNAIWDGDLKKARELLVGLSLPLCSYEERALNYTGKVLKGVD